MTPTRTTSGPAPTQRRAGGEQVSKLGEATAPRPLKTAPRPLKMASP